MQAMAKLPEVQAAMSRHFNSQASRAGLGLELLPGVQQLLETLKVRRTVSVAVIDCECFSVTVSFSLLME